MIAVCRRLGELDNPGAPEGQGMVSTAIHPAHRSADANLPAVHDGNLWSSNANSPFTIGELAKANLGTTGDPTPAVIISPTMGEA